MGKEIQKWADEAMFSAEPMEESKPRVYLLSATPDPLGSIAATCMMYEGKVVRTLKDVNDEERKHYWEQVQQTHLKAPLEFVDLHFMIEGVTRSFTHQMVRQRTAVYAQESLRFAVKENMAEEVPLPPSLDREAPAPLPLDILREGERVWVEAIEKLDESYKALVGMGVPAEDARGLLPHSVTTRLHYKTNLRNLLDHAGNRLCTQAQFEWRAVFGEILNEIKSYESEYSYPKEPFEGDPNQLYDRRAADWQWNHIVQTDVFKPVCFSLGHCPFTADFDRGCTIRDRVQAGEFDKIHPAEWALDPTAARRKEA